MSCFHRRHPAEPESELDELLDLHPDDDDRATAEFASAVAMALFLAVLFVLLVLA